MPVLRCAEIQRIVAEEVRNYQKSENCQQVRRGTFSFSDISDSEFIRHIRDETFFIDKSLVLIDFLGDDGESPCTKDVLEHSDFSAASGSSLPMNQPKANLLKRSLLSSSNRAKQMRVIDATTSGAENHSSDSDSDSENEFSEPGCSRALISRPRRFGKTFNLSMMNDFLRMGDTPVSEYGRRIVFQQTALWKQYPDFCAENFANHPVIFLTFKVCEPFLFRFQ